MRYLYEACDWWQRSDIWSQASYRYLISWEAFFDPSDSYFLFADLVGFYTHWTYMHIFRHIFLSNYWWQRSDIWSQASSIWGTYMKLVTKYQISAINSCWEKCDEKWAYMFNVYKNQQSRQTGSRNLMGPKMLPTVLPLSVCPSSRPSKIFFVTLFSVTVDGRNLIFGHKHHIGFHIVGSVFGPVRFLLPVCRLSWFYASHDMGYLYEDCDQQSDFCHQ
jgi:hypothetical protein